MENPILLNFVNLSTFFLQDNRTGASTLLQKLEINSRVVPNQGSAMNDFKMACVADIKLLFYELILL